MVCRVHFRLLGEDMQSTQTIVKGLQDRKVTAVAKATGLSPHTIYRLIKSKNTPRRATLTALENYLNGEKK
jgi:DNA-binding phage protein